MTWIESRGSGMFGNLKLTDLSIDEAYVTFKAESSPQLWLYSLSEDCFECPFERLSRIAPNFTIKVSTRRAATWRVLREGVSQLVPASDTSALVCNIPVSLGEFGVYRLKAENETCHVDVIRDPVNIYYPLLLCFLLMVVLWCGCIVRSRVAQWWKRCNRHPAEEMSGLQLTTGSPGDAQETPRRRLRSLDTFRGISIMVMIFVNHGAGNYWFLEHATWNGLTVADLVFPWFMWIMGVCIPLSVKGQLKRGIPRGKILRGVLRRGVLLLLLGVSLNSLTGPNLAELRLPGVLQRFAVTYVICATLITLTPRSSSTPRAKPLAVTQDVWSLLPQWLIVLGLAGAHTAILFFVEVPGCTLGYLGPGGRHDDGRHANCTGGAAGLVDRTVFGEAHMYQHPDARTVYDARPFDPEGLLGCLTSVLQVFLGVQAGTTLSLHREWRDRVVRWLAWGTLVGVGGAALCGASQEDGVVPINKNLWSLSFVLITSCFAFYLLSALFLIIDVKEWWSGSPFYYAGMNSTIMYVGHELCYQLFPWHWRIGPMDTHMMVLLENLWGTIGWLLVAYWLYQKQFFLSL